MLRLNESIKCSVIFCNTTMMILAVISLSYGILARTGSMVVVRNYL